MLGYNVAKECASPRNLTWFTRPFLLVRGWGLGTRLTGPVHRTRALLNHIYKIYNIYNIYKLNLSMVAIPAPEPLR